MANENNLLPKIELEKEKSKDVNYNRLKKIRINPNKVILEDIETGEIKTFPSIYRAAKFIDRAPRRLPIGEMGKELGIINTWLLLNKIVFFNLRFFYIYIIKWRINCSK